MPSTISLSLGPALMIIPDLKQAVFDYTTLQKIMLKKDRLNQEIKIVFLKYFVKYRCIAKTGRKMAEINQIF